jgi:hypothetical protein
MKKIAVIGLLILIIGIGCNTSKITSSWKAENVLPEKYNKILVLGLIREADRTIQEKMETHIVDDLKNLGYNAVSSLKEYGLKAFDKMEEEAAIAKLKNSGVDAVLTIVLLDKEKEKRYVPGDIHYSPYGYYQNRFWRYRTLLYYRIYEPGYYVTDTRYFWESNLYKMDDQKLIYSVQTQSFSPANMETMAHEYGRMIVKNMMRENVLQQQGGTVSKPF